MANIGDHLRQLRDLVIAVFSAFKKRNSRRLRKLNDDILSAAAIDFSAPYFNLAIYSYVLSKITSKPRFMRRECEGRLIEIENSLSELIDMIGRSDESAILEVFKKIKLSIERLEENDVRFIIDLVTKGKLKTAATLYAQGMSLGVSSELTGMEKQEIMDYAGETMMFDRLKDEKSINDRMKNARRLIEWE